MNITSVPAIIFGRWCHFFFFQAVWNKSLIEADWVHIVSHMYSLCWRSIHSNTEMYSCGATACLTHSPTLTHMQMPTGTCTHAHTIRGNLYLIHSISNLRQPERNCFFFCPFSPQHRHSYFNSGNRCTEYMQEILCLLHHHCCVIHMLVEISRQSGKDSAWKTETFPLP